MVLKHNREFRIETLSNLLSNLSMFLGFALSLVFIIHILFFSSSYDVSIAQILRGFLGFTLLYLTFRGIYKRNIIFLISKQNFLKYIFTMPIIVILFIILYKLLLNDLDGYIRRMGEGSLVEWLSFLSLLLSSFLVFQTSKNNLNKKECILLKIFSLLLFIFSMEEISWGQMIFNWNIPKIIDSINIQS